MRIDELTPYRKTSIYQAAKQVRDEKLTNIIDHLESHGFAMEPIGTGYFAYVFKRPQNNYVIKVFKDDAGYLKYFNFIKKNQNNPHVPKIYGNIMKPYKDSNIYIVRIELLRDYNSSKEYSLISDIENYLDQGENSEFADRFPMLHKNISNSIANIKENYPKLAELLDTIQHMSSDDLDISSNNIMFRNDGTPVITDPYNS